MERETRIPPETEVPLVEDGLFDGEKLHFPVEDGDDQGALEQALLAAAFILRYIGGAVTFAAIRKELRPGTKVYITVEIVMTWHSYMPALPTEEDGQNGHVEEPVAATG